MAKAIAFDAELRQVKTMADHTVNIVINIPEYHLDKAAELMLHTNEQVEIVIVVEEISPNNVQL